MYIYVYADIITYIFLYYFTHILLAWLKFLEVYINEPSINKSIRQIRYLASTLIGDNRIAWLLKVISFIDLTTLSGGDTSSNVESLCLKVY